MFDAIGIQFIRCLLYVYIMRNNIPRKPCGGRHFALNMLMNDLVRSQEEGASVRGLILLCGLCCIIGVHVLSDHKNTCSLKMMASYVDRHLSLRCLCPHICFIVSVRYKSSGSLATADTQQYYQNSGPLAAVDTSTKEHYRLKNVVLELVDQI